MLRKQSPAVLYSWSELLHFEQLLAFAPDAEAIFRSDGVTGVLYGWSDS